MAAGVAGHGGEHDGGGVGDDRVHGGHVNIILLDAGQFDERAARAGTVLAGT